MSDDSQYGGKIRHNLFNDGQIEQDNFTIVFDRKDIDMKLNMWSISGSQDQFKSSYSGYIGLAPFTPNLTTRNFKKREQKNNFIS